MQHYQETEALSEDIDLIHIFKKSKSAVNKWKKTILYFLIGGVVAGVIYYLVVTPLYKSRMIVTSSLLKGPTFVVVIDDLQRHINENNFNEVAFQLGLDSLTVSKLDQIKVSSVKTFAEKELSSVITQEETANEDDSNSGEFILEVHVSDGKILKPLETGLVYYLNNNAYIKQKSREKRKNLSAMKARVQQEMMGLDSLKNALRHLYDGSRKAGATNLSINDPSAIYNNIIGLYQSQLNAETELNSPDIEVVQSFIPYKKQSHPKLGSSILSGLLFSLIAAVIYILYKESSALLKDI